LVSENVHSKPDRLSENRHVVNRPFDRDCLDPTRGNQRVAARRAMRRDTAALDRCHRERCKLAERDRQIVSRHHVQVYIAGARCLAICGKPQRGNQHPQNR
jgi:hypothetical protein